jgi:7-cyano-7-deazaguanine synthase
VILEEIRKAFPAWSSRLGEDHLLNLDALRELGATALTHDVEIRMQEAKLPNTFVPGRNIVFFTLAAALAYRRDIRVLVGGMCETDFSGYPDCRDDTVKAVQVALGLGMDTRFTLETPLMWLDKAATWKLAAALGGEELVRITIEHTHTCYLGDRKHKHAWGYGCGRCPACELRKKGYAAYSAA